MPQSSDQASIPTVVLIVALFCFVTSADGEVEETVEGTVAAMSEGPPRKVKRLSGKSSFRLSRLRALHFTPGQPVDGGNFSRTRENVLFKSQSGFGQKMRENQS